MILLALKRDFHLHPLVLLKLAICKLHLAGVFGLVEFCRCCGRRVHEIWHAAPELWSHVTGLGDGGVFCIRCFDERARRAGRLLMWVPRVECARGARGRWADVAQPDPELFPEASRRSAEERAS